MIHHATSEQLLIASGRGNRQPLGIAIMAMTSHSSSEPGHDRSPRRMAQKQSGKENCAPPKVVHTALAIEPARNTLAASRSRFTMSLLSGNECSL